MRRLLPEPGETSVDELLGRYRPFESPHADRPFVAANMITTLDGRASVRGRSKDLGSEVDSEFLLKLRRRFDAVMVGAGTIRAERYGRIVRDAGRQGRSGSATGLSADPLAVIVSGGLDLPFDAPIFTCGAGRDPDLHRQRPDPSGDRHPESSGSSARRTISAGAVLRHLRQESGVRAVLCEGGPHLLGQLEAG